MVREIQEALPLLGVERDGHALEPVHRERAFLGNLAAQRVAGGLRRGLKLRQRGLLRDLPRSQLGENVRVPLTVTDDRGGSVPVL